jgi:O-Antigen ligase
MAPLQAASVFTVWAITAGGEILRSWLLTAVLCTMSLPLLLGLEGSLLAMMLFEPVRGLLRRAQYLIVPYSTQDPIHVLTPVVTFMAMIVLLRKERLNVFWATPLAKSVSILGLIFFLEIFNPLQGSLFVGLTGALFMLVPVAWFYFGQTVTDEFLHKAMVVIVALGIIGSLWGVYQLVFGYPAFEQYWIDNTDFYTSIAVGHVRRALATFSSAEEWGRYTQIGAIISVGMAMAKQRVAKRMVWGLCAAALPGAILISGQRTAVFGFVVGAVALILLGASTWQKAATRLAVMMLPFVLVLVFVQAPTDDEIWTKDESQTVSTILTHTQRGTLKPAEEESLQIRFENWGYLLTSVIPFRPLGAGLGTSQLADMRENRDSELPPVDNFILVVALACGIPGALLFVWILSRATWFSVQLARADDAHPNAAVRRIVAAIMPALILNSVFGLTFSIYSVAPIAWLVIGWISAETLRMRQAPEAREIITI